MPKSQVTPLPFTRVTAAHVHPQLIHSLLVTGLFPITVTIQARSDDRTPAGGFNSPADWVTILAGIPARRGVPPLAERRPEERPESWGRIDELMFMIVLAGYYPQISSDMRAVTSDGNTVDIRGVYSDSATQITTLTARITTPGSEGYK